jgi:hypothetical protein
MNRATNSIISAALLSIGLSLDLSSTVSARPQAQPYICATNNTEVNIRDNRTLQTVGKLNYGECLESYNWYYHEGRPTLRMRVIDQESYYVVVGGKSGQIRLVAARYVNIVWR